MRPCTHCQHFHAESSLCALNPVHVPIAAPDAHTCGQFKAQSTTFITDMAGPAEKVADTEILSWFETMPEQTARAVIAPFLATKFGVTSRTIKERLRRLQGLGILKCAMPLDPGPNDKPFWMFAKAFSDEAASRAWWSSILAQQKPRGWALLSGKGRVRDFSDIQGAFNALSATADTPRSFSDLFRAQCQLSSMGKSTFSRLLNEAVTQSLVTKSESGLYGLIISPAQ